MQLTQVLLWIIVILVLLFLASTFHLEGFATPVVQTLPPVVNAADVSTPPTTVSTPQNLPVAGATSSNVVNGKAPDSAYIDTVTIGIRNNTLDVLNATTAGVPIQPSIGSAQQIAAPGADSSAATIQNKPVAAKSTLSPSALPSDLLSATTTVMPSNAPFRAPASMLTASNAMPTATPTTMQNVIPKAPMPVLTPKDIMPSTPLPGECCSDNTECGDCNTCNQMDGFYNF